MECFDNKDIIFTVYYVCTNCGVIRGCKFIHEISCYENENSLIKKIYFKIIL